MPPRQNRKIQYHYDEHVYVERYVIECFLSKIRHFRQGFTRFDKAKTTFQAFIDFAAALISLRCSLMSTEPRRGSTRLGKA